MNSLMEKNNEHFVNEKETDLLMKKIEIEWDFQSEDTQSESKSFLQLPSPRYSQDQFQDKKKQKKRKKKRKNNFLRPIESDEVKRDFLSNFNLDFEKQIDKDIFVQYGEFSDYISLFNQKFNRPEKKICKFSLERLSKSVKKLLVFGENFNELSDMFKDKNDEIKNNYFTKETKINKIPNFEKNGIKSMNVLKSSKDPFVSTWKTLQKSLSLTPLELRKIPPGLNKFINKTENSKFKLKKLNPYELFIEKPKEEKKSVLSLSPKDILPNLQKSRGEKTQSNVNDLVNIISQKKPSSLNKISKIDSLSVSLNQNSFLTHGVNSDNSSLAKLNSLSTMNQTRITDKISSYINSNGTSTFEKKESIDGVEETDSYDIYNKNLSKNEINEIMNRLKTKTKSKKKERFSEIIKYRCSLKPQKSFNSEAKPTKTKLESEDSLIQIKVTSCEGSNSNTELKPKRSIFSQMNNPSKQDFFSINEAEHIKEEEEDETSSQSQSLRESLKIRVSKSSTNNNSFLFPNTRKDELKPSKSGNLIQNEDPFKIIKINSLNVENKTKPKTHLKSGKKLKLKKKKFLKEYIPSKKRSNQENKKTLSSFELKQNQTLNPHNYPEYGQTPHLLPPTQPHPQYSVPQYPPQYGHYPMPSAPLNPNLMPRYPQPRVAMYPNTMYMPPMYPQYQNYPVQNGSFMPNGVYMQNQPVFYNMQGYHQMQQSSTSPGQSNPLSQNGSKGDNSSEVNSFAK